MARVTGNVISYSNYFFVDWQLTGQNEEGNYSSINWQAYWHFQASDRQLDDGNVVIDGSSRWDNGGRLYNYVGNFSTRDMGLASGSMNIGHDSNGNKTFNINGSVLGYSGERSSLSGNFGLPGLYRYADPTYVEANGVTDVGFNFRVDTNRTCDALAVSLTGGGNWNYFYGDFTSHTMSLGGVGAPLVSGQTYPVRISLRRKNSGFWKEAGNWNVTTLSQNNFFDLGF